MVPARSCRKFRSRCSTRWPTANPTQRSIREWMESCIRGKEMTNLVTLTAEWWVRVFSTDSANLGGQKSEEKVKMRVETDVHRYRHDLDKTEVLTASLVVGRSERMWQRIASGKELSLSMAGAGAGAGAGAALPFDFPRRLKKVSSCSMSACVNEYC